MKAILFYNPYSAPDLELKDKVAQTGLHVECIDIMSDLDNPFKRYIRATPALITITDDMQGEFLEDSEVDTITLIEATLIQLQDKEEQAVHKQNNNRLDQHINSEKRKSKIEAEDALTLELIEGGLI